MSTSSRARGDKDKPWVKTLVESYHDDSIKSFINDEFKGALIPSW